MSGGGSGKPQTVNQTNEPWPGAKNYTLQLYQRAADALNRTTMDAAPVNYAGPTGAQLGANQGVIDWANANMGKGGVVNPAIANIMATMNMGTQKLGQAGPTYESMPGFNPMNFATPAATDSFNPKTFDGSMFGFNAQGYKPMPGFNAQGFNATGFGTAPGFSYNGTSFNPTGAYGADTSAAVDQFAGAAPQLSGTDELTAAINAAMAPLQRNLEENILPQAKLSGVETGTYGGDAQGLEMSKLIRDEFAKPMSDTIGNLVYQNMGRKEGLQSQQYMQRYGAGAEATQNSFSRMLQDAMQGKQLTAEQQQLMNQLGFSDVQSLRDYGSKNTEMLNSMGFQNTNMLNQLGLQDIGQQRQLSADETQMLNNLGFSNISQLRDLMTQQTMNNNQLGLQDIMNQRGMNLSTADMLNKYGLQDIGQIRDLMAQQSQAKNAFNLNAYGLGNDFFSKMLMGQTAAGSAIPGMAQSGMQMDLMPLQALSGAGAEQQGWNQADMDAILKKWQAQNSGYWNGLNEFNSIMSGSPQSQLQTTSGGGQSTGGKLLGGAIGGSLLGAGAASSGLLGAGIAGGPMTWPLVIGGLLGMSMGLF